jgi:hypothetical protein
VLAVLDTSPPLLYSTSREFPTPLPYSDLSTY